ncbi:NrtA/SsuA/CpmA family ABC transporter substrate-binding protein, partial [Motilibacter deserti]
MRTPTTRRGLLAAAAAALSLAGLTACGSDEPDAAPASAAEPAATVRIAVLNGADNALALSRADGSLEQAVTAAGGKAEWVGPFPAFAPAAEAIKAGAADITVGGLLSWVGGLAANPDLVVFGRQPDDGAGSGIVATADSGVKTVADLKGKKVAVNQAGTGEYLLLKALEKEGLSPDDVERVYLPVTDGATAFQSGKVDAWATWGNFFASAASAEGAHVVATAGDVGSRNDTVYVVDRSFLDEHPDVVKAVYDAFDAEVEKVTADP